MRREIDERKCDNCGLVVQQAEVMFGGSPFNGWLHVKITNCSTKLPKSKGNDGPWDFCCYGCAITYLQQLEHP